MGEFDADLMLNIEDQDPKDKEIGDEFLQKLEETLVKHLDPEKVDATGELPEGFIEKLAELGVFGMKVPAEYEGLGFSQVNYNRAATKIASYDGATATLVSAHQSIGVPNPLKMFDTCSEEEILPHVGERRCECICIDRARCGIRSSSDEYNCYSD